MNERRHRRVPRIRLRRALRNVVLVSVVATLLILGGLWVQMSLGRDPSLGPKLAATRSGQGGTVAAAPSPAPAVEDGEDDGETDDESGTVTPSVQVAPAPATILPPVQTSTS